LSLTNIKIKEKENRRKISTRTIPAKDGPGNKTIQWHPQTSAKRGFLSEKETKKANLRKQKILEKARANPIKKSEKQIHRAASSAEGNWKSEGVSRKNQIRSSSHWGETKTGSLTIWGAIRRTSTQEKQKSRKEADRVERCGAASQKD